MTSNRKQKTLTALIETYGSSVTRKNLIEFEQAGRGNVVFVAVLYRSGRGKYQLPAVYVETPAERDIRRAKKREYNRRWAAKESPEKRKIRIAKQREYNAHRAQTRTLLERAKLADYNREYHRARYANVEERRERDRRSLKPYPKSYRDKVIANYALNGLTVSQRMLDELNGNRDPQTPPLFRRT